MNRIVFDCIIFVFYKHEILISNFILTLIFWYALNTFVQVMVVAGDTLVILLKPSALCVTQKFFLEVLGSLEGVASTLAVSKYVIGILLHWLFFCGFF